MNRKKSANNDTTQEQFVFEGFEPSNTTPVPDVLFDRLLAHLTGAELKVLLYIIRRTWGFKKDTDAISLTQFKDGIKTKDGRVLDEGCGVSDRQTIVNALQALETKGCVESEKNKTAHGDNAISIYKVRFQRVVGKSNHLSEEGSRKIQPHGVVGKSNRGSMENPTGVVGKSNPQETVLQETVKQQTEESITDHSQNGNTSSNDAIHTLIEEMMKRLEVVEQENQSLRSDNQLLLEKLSTQAQQLPTSNTQDKPTSTEADEQASYSHPATQNELPGTPVKEPIQQDTLLPKEEKPTIPVMPPTTAKWCPETAIQIVEAKLGKYYRQVARDKELGFARRMFKEDSELTREQFEAAYDKRNDKWWHDHKGLLHLHHMIEKDRIHEMLDKIEVESIGEYHGNKRIISFPVITQPQKQLVAAGTGFFTEGVLAGQPDYHADPWA